MNSTPGTIQVSRNWLLAKQYAAIDTEFEINYENKSKPFTLFAASIVDSLGRSQARHVSDFHTSYPEKELVIWLMGQIVSFRLTMGWYSKGVKIEREDGTVEGKDSDLKVIDSLCKYYDIPSIIEFNLVGIPRVKGYDPTTQCAMWNRYERYYHIDLFQVYKKPIVRSIIYNNKYRSLGLDVVSRALLGEGKLEGLDGHQAIEKLPVKKQLEYVTQDARLVMKLSQHNDYEILDLMHAISIITGLKFEKVCHTQLSTWWKKIIEDKIFCGDCRPPAVKIKKKSYLGGYVIEPKVGFYDKENVYVLDVKSLYPSMMISHNISFDTVNCNCCQNDSTAKVSHEIMSIINSSLAEEGKREQYWICRDSNYTGIVPRLLQQYRDERFRQQDLGNELMQLALKNLINGCYGIFGSTFFEFSDYRVAELTTAFGRQVIQYMQHIAKEVYEFDIIYGDTDSIFVTGAKNENDIKKFIAECLLVLNLDIEESEVFKKFLIVKKKHYIGISLDKGKSPVIKGMEGIKADRPEWINRLQRQLADDLKNDRDPTINIRKEYRAMEEGSVSLDELSIKLVLKKNPQEYKPNSLQRKVGLESGAEQGDVLEYYKSRTAGGGTSRTNLLCRQKYLEMLKSTVGATLRFMGYDFDLDVIGCKKLYDFIS